MSERVEATGLPAEIVEPAAHRKASAAKAVRPIASQDDMERLLADLQPDTMDTANLDVSEWFGKPEGTVIWRFQEPDVAKLFVLKSDADEFKKRNPMWPVELCQMVALLAVCYVAPMPKTPVGVMMERLARENRRLFLALIQGVQEAFPHLSDLDGAAKAAKNA